MAACSQRRAPATACQAKLSVPSHTLTLQLAHVPTCAHLGTQGFGCQLLFVVEVLRLCELFAIQCAIALVSRKAYHDEQHGRDFLGYAFDTCLTHDQFAAARRDFACRRAVKMRADRILRTMRAVKNAARLRLLQLPPVSAGAVFETPSVQAAGQLFGRSFALRPELLALAERFWARHFGPRDDACVIGVHFRGQYSCRRCWQAKCVCVCVHGCVHIFVPVLMPSTASPGCVEQLPVCDACARDQAVVVTATARVSPRCHSHH